MQRVAKYSRGESLHGGSFAMMICTPRRGVAQVQGTDRWAQLQTANNLIGEGKTAFHLLMSFQLYDLAGKPSEAGTAEEWWDGAHQPIRVMIHSPSFNEDSLGVNRFDLSTAREGYLVHELLEMAVRPVPEEDPGFDHVFKEQKRDFGKLRLKCLAGTSKNEEKTHVALITVCEQSSLDDVRIMLMAPGSEEVTRNSIGKFHDTYVALDLQIGYVRRHAIEGKITTLESVNSANPGAEAPTSPAAISPVVEGPAAARVARVPEDMIKGSRTAFRAPVYPQVARDRHMSGSVLLRAIISKDGTTKNLVPIASTDPAFTTSAMEAASHWVYKPYLVHGEPTEVDTTVTVNFALDPS